MTGGDRPRLIQDERFRVRMTASCRDCDGIPKVAGAGEIVVEHGETVQIMHNGIRVVAGGYHGEWMAEVIRALRGHHEPQEELAFDAVLRLVPDNAAMLELGGFWSYYSLWFLARKPARTAIVVEPDPNNLAVGRRNAKLNGAAIDFVQGFVGPRSAPSVPFATETAGTLALDMICVSQLVAARGIAFLDVLHCDAQGAELTVLEDCRDLLRAKAIGFCVVSTHAEAISGDPLTHQRCLDLVRSCGGRVLVEHDVHESFSGDGLIVAYFGRKPIDWPQLAVSRNRYSASLFRNPLYDLDEARQDNARLHAELEALKKTLKKSWTFPFLRNRKPR